MDVRSLLDGKWPGTGLMKLRRQENTGTGMDVQDGMGYKDYMRMLLFLEGKERMSMRAMGIGVQEKWRLGVCETPQAA